MTTEGPPALVVHIDSLELIGVPEARRHAVASAFQAELSRLLTTSPPSPPLASQPELSLPPVRLGVGLPPERMGARLAAAVHAGLVGGPTDRGGAR